MNKKYFYYKYNYDQNFLDLIKINSYIINIVNKIIAMGFEIYSININLKDVK